MQKLYHSISEVSELVDEEQHILRYWEKEFEQLRPKKNRGGNRIYSNKDLVLIKLIKKFLRADKLSLKGAKEQLERFIGQGQEATLFGSTGTAFNDLNIDLVRKSQKSGTDSIFVNRKEIQELYESLKELSNILK
ncbi:MAG: MerR family transcriptional regulator [Ignavibacteriae bacterium]|nr:MerR family transcriptional regulator [Ignavibacteriota bacterium]